MQERISVDDTFPCDTAFLAESRNRACLQHGGVCTRFTFDKVEQMDLAEFLRTEVPKLTKQTDKLTVIRDAAGGCYMVMLGDQVIRYNLRDVVEVPMDALLECCDTAKEQVYTPGIPFPLVCQAIGSNCDRITVMLPAAKRRFQYLPSEKSSWKETFDIYTPPLWFGVRTSKAAGLLEVRVAVVLDQEMSIERAQLYRWPLSNVFDSGSVCMGSVSVSSPFGSVGRSGANDVLGAALDMFFNSENNNDLSSDCFDSDNLDSVFSNCANKQKFIDMMAGKDSATKSMLKRLCVMSEPDGWRLLKYKPLCNTTKGFCISA